MVIDLEGQEASSPLIASQSTSQSTVEETAREPLNPSHPDANNPEVGHDGVTMDASNLEEVACYGKAATELQSFVSHEMNVLKRQAATARDATKKHARKISRVIIDAWTCCHFSALPTWMQDNDYLLASHRPQLNCFKVRHESEVGKQVAHE